MRSRRWVWFCALAALAVVGLDCGSDQGPGEGLAIIPGSMSLEVSSTQQFTAEVNGVALAARWYVDGIRGGSPEKGMVTSTGLYVAPADLPPGSAITLRAEAFGDTLEGADATITITKPDLTPYVTVSPDTSSIGAWASDSILFASQVVNCADDSVVWSISKVYGNPVSPGLIFSDGLYVAPSAPKFQFALLVKATSVGCPTKAGIAKIVVYAPLDTFSVEMEAFAQRYDIGASDIRSAACGSASGGYAVKGMNNAGEWIKVAITVPATGTYQPYLDYQADTGKMTSMSMEMTGCGSSDAEASFWLEEGEGMG